jgi:hypothetical protein
MLLLCDLGLSCMDMIVNIMDFGGILEVCPKLEAIFNHPDEVLCALAPFSTPLLPMQVSFATLFLYLQGHILTCPEALSSVALGIGHAP